MATSVEQKSLNEAKPTHTAQDIGLIFIREYYTFLNKTPSHLHAFYNKDSLFVRGDEGTISETARGQEVVYILDTRLFNLTLNRRLLKELTSAILKIARFW